MSLIDMLDLPSRFFLAPINTGYADNGVPTEKLLQFHKERAGRRIGVAYVGNVAISKDFKTNDGTAVISDEHYAVWQALAQVINEQGSLPAIQLACKVAPMKSQPGWLRSDLDEFIQVTASFISNLSSEQIHATCESFVRSAILGSKFGFRIVQIHAAHGYLLALLLNRTMNRRADVFADGTHALKIIANGIQANCPDLTMDVRVSLFDGLENPAAEKNYRADQIAKLTTMGYRFISLSAGMYDINRASIYPDGNRPYLPQAIELANQFSNTIWNVAGRLGPLIQLEQKVPDNMTFSIGRPLIADPSFVEKSLSGCETEIIHCALTNRCHYFSRGKPHIECGVNDSV